MITCIVDRRKNAIEDNTDVNNCAIGRQNNGYEQLLTDMITRQLNMGKNVKRLILAVPAYLDTQELNKVRSAAASAVQQSRTGSLPYPIAIVRESMAIALDYRQ